MSLYGWLAVGSLLVFAVCLSLWLSLRKGGVADRLADDHQALIDWMQRSWRDSDRLCSLAFRSARTDCRTSEFHSAPGHHEASKARAEEIEHQLDESFRAYGEFRMPTPGRMDGQPLPGRTPMPINEDAARAAFATLRDLGYTYNPGAMRWKPPLGPAPRLEEAPEPARREFRDRPDVQTAKAESWEDYVRRSENAATTNATDPYDAKWRGIAEAFRGQDNRTDNLINAVDARVSALYEQLALVGVAVKELETWRGDMIDTTKGALDELRRDDRIGNLERRLNNLVELVAGEGYTLNTFEPPLREQVVKLGRRINSIVAVTVGEGYAIDVEAEGTLREQVAGATGTVARIENELKVLAARIATIEMWRRPYG